MQCPQCSSSKSGVLATRQQDDGRILRRRHCKACKARWATFEVDSRDVKDAEEGKPDFSKQMAAACPLARQQELFDLESAMEETLQDAMDCVRKTLAGAMPPDKVVTDLARWVIEDRRAWRKAMAEQSAITGQVHADPAVAQLASVLRIVPNA